LSARKRLEQEHYATYFLPPSRVHRTIHEDKTEQGGSIPAACSHFQFKQLYIFDSRMREVAIWECRNAVVCHHFQRELAKFTLLWPVAPDIFFCPRMSQKQSAQTTLELLLNLYRSQLQQSNKAKRCKN